MITVNNSWPSCHELSADKLVLKHGRTSEGFIALAIAGAAVLATALIVKWLVPEL